MFTAPILAGLLLLQAPPASKPAAPAPKNGAVTAPATAIPAARSADIGPTVDVAPSLIALAPTDTVGVIYIPSAAEADAMAKELAALGGSMRSMLAGDNAVLQFLKANLKTELAIPLDQPILLWITMPVADENDPEQDAMGGPDIRSYMAMKIPGATAETVKAKTRRASVTVLPGDLVVVGNQKAPYQAPAAGSAACPLMKQLPAGTISGRLDLATIMREQEDNLRMGASFLGMQFSSSEPLGDGATQADRDAAAMKQQFGAALSDQVTALVDLLAELQSASFSVAVTGDQLHVWTDWTRKEPWPAGMAAADSAADVALLPAGLPMYAGASRATIGLSLNKRVSLDDALMTLGATDDEKKAWSAATDKMREVIDMVAGGVAAGFGNLHGKSGATLAFRVRDAAAFQSAYSEAVRLIGQTGIYDAVKVDRTGDDMITTVTPNTKRLQRIAAAFGGDLTADQVAAMNANAKPVQLSMHFKGNSVTMEVIPEAGVPGDYKMPDGRDLRAQINATGWGDTDWFVALDLRVIVAAANLAENKDFHLADGPPVLLSIRQGVRAGTQRLSLDTNIKNLGTLVDQYEKEAARLRTIKRKNAPAQDDAPQAPDDASMPGAP
jgi:hypothetical protein